MMKRKCFLFLHGVVLIAAVSVHVNLSLRANSVDRDILLANVEALVEEENPTNCLLDPLTYVVGAYENWQYYTATQTFEIGVPITIGDIVLVLGFKLNKGRTIRFPECKHLENNCCIKTHLEKPVEKVNW